MDAGVYKIYTCSRKSNLKRPVIIPMVMESWLILIFLGILLHSQWTKLENKTIV
jgi:hypothetical protein